jgi:hypothetical protein
MHSQQEETFFGSANEKEEHRMTYEEGKAALQNKLTMLPGRVAGLFKLPPELIYESKGGILIGDKTVALMRNMEIPPFELDRGEVIASGDPDIPVGSVAAAMPTEGFWIKHNDSDMPEIGALVPENCILKLFGIKNAIEDQIPALG